MLMLIGKILAGYPTRHLPGKPLQNPAPLPLPGKCRVVPGRCRVVHPAGIFIVQDGVFGLFFPRCRVCRVPFRGEVEAWIRQGHQRALERVKQGTPRAKG